MKKTELILALSCVGCTAEITAPRAAGADATPTTGGVQPQAAGMSTPLSSAAVTSDAAPSTFSKEDILSLIGDGGVKAGEPWSAASLRLTKLLGAPTFVIAASGATPSEESSFWVTRFDSPGEPISRHGFATPGKGGNGCHRLVVAKSNQNGLVVNISYAFVAEGELLETPTGPVNGCTGTRSPLP